MQASYHSAIKWLVIVFPTFCLCRPISQLSADIELNVGSRKSLFAVPEDPPWGSWWLTAQPRGSKISSSCSSARNVTIHDQLFFHRLRTLQYERFMSFSLKITQYYASCWVLPAHGSKFLVMHGSPIHCSVNAFQSMHSKQAHNNASLNNYSMPMSMPAKYILQHNAK